MELLKNVLNKSVEVAKALLYTLVAGLICSIPLLLVWNWVVPAVFGFHAINLLQAFGLSLLSEILLTPYSQPVTINLNERPAQNAVPPCAKPCVKR